MRDTFPGLDRAEHGLRPVRVDTALGFVFVCLAGDPPPVAKTWGKLAEELAPYRFEDMVPLAPITTDVWNVDWKIAMDNYLESYHVPIGHPGLYRMFTPDYEDQALGAGRGAGPELDARATLLALVGAAVSVDHRQGGRHLPEKLRRCWRFYSALPNLGIDVFPDQMDFFQLLPGGPGKCIVRGTTFGLPDPSPALRAARFLVEPHQHPGQQRGQVAVRPRAARARLEQLSARSAVEDRRVHVRVPQPAARADSGVPAAECAEAVRLAGPPVIHQAMRRRQTSGGMRRAFTPMRSWLLSTGAQCVMQPQCLHRWNSSLRSPQVYMSVAPVGGETSTSWGE